jgi:hypothetical protein
MTANLFILNTKLKIKIIFFIFINIGIPTHEAFQNMPRFLSGC